MAARPANPILRREILSAAWRIVEKQGAGALTMRAVAEDVRCSPTSIYLHFRNKAGLLNSVVTEVYELFEDYLVTAETNDSPVGKIRQRSLAYVEWAIRNPDSYRLMFETLFDEELVRDTPPEVTYRRKRGLTHMAALIESAAGQGQLRLGRIDAQRLSAVAWAAMHGIASLSISWRLFGIPGVMLSVDEAVSRARALTEDWLEVWLRDLTP